jgi:ferrous iron transport protein B
MSGQITAALAGQPNAGKSTVFNMLTGARQHVANYPGVTVEKKTGAYSHNGSKVELVDLPGTYSLTSYSLEERVAREFLLTEAPSAVINVIDASNLKRHLNLTFQLLEMGRPVVIALNMMDVARSRGIEINIEKLSELLSVPVIPTVGKKGQGKKELKEAVTERAESGSEERTFHFDYGDLEPSIEAVSKEFSQAVALPCPERWLAVKLLEADSEAEKLVRDSFGNAEHIFEKISELREKFEKEQGKAPERYIAYARHAKAQKIVASCIAEENVKTGDRLSDKIDSVVCHRVLGPITLVAVLYGMYQMSIVQGYELTNYFWPLLAGMRDFIASVLPQPGFIEVPILRSMVLWFTDSANALLNYIPIFFILFAIIAFLEDCGYMPRIAFLLDRLFRRFGLHGQSTLPLILAGVYVGGCAVPGVMSCRAIPDERARLATILIVPLMNCLAKVPLYVLLIGAYFAEHKGFALFFIATVTIFMALPIAKVLSLTALKNKESAPFILEMPPYHLPTISGVLRRAVERVWLFLRKIVTIVAAVSVVVFALLQFPGLNTEEKLAFEQRAETAKAGFYKKIEGNPFAEAVQGEDKLMGLFRYQERYKAARRGVTDKDKAKAIDERYIAENEAYFTILKPKRNKEAKVVSRAFKMLDRDRKGIMKDMKDANLDKSFLGIVGRAIEPATQYAGFDQMVNISLLAAFAAKESTVATLGALYEQEEEGEALQERIQKQSTGYTPLHALALMLFMALYPPCLATSMTVKMQAGHTKWMLLSIAYPMLLGVFVSVLIFTGGTLMGLTGLEAMIGFYALAIMATVAAALYNPKSDIA